MTDEHIPWETYRLEIKMDATLVEDGVITQVTTPLYEEFYYRDVGPAYEVSIDKELIMWSAKNDGRSKHESLVRAYRSLQATATPAQRGSEEVQGVSEDELLDWLWVNTESFKCYATIVNHEDGHRMTVHSVQYTTATESGIVNSPTVVGALQAAYDAITTSAGSDEPQ